MKRMRILLLDDDVVFRKGLALHLRKDGHEVVEPRPLPFRLGVGEDPLEQPGGEPGQRQEDHHESEVEEGVEVRGQPAGVLAQPGDAGGRQVVDQIIGARQKPDQILHPRVVAHDRDAGGSIGKLADDTRELVSFSPVDSGFHRERRRELATGGDQLRW